MRVLVTGGAGFIGSHIVDQLLLRGHQTYVIDDLSTGCQQNISGNVPLFEIDICDGAAVAAVFEEVRPQWVCHQAAQMSVSQSMRDPVFDAKVNVLGLLNVLEHAARAGTERVVYASSGGVLYGDVTSPATEDSPKCPISPYGIAKWVGEQYLEFYAREGRLKGIALRYANVYGPRQNPHGEAGVVAIFCQKMLAGNQATINGDGRYIRDYVFAHDVARANVLAFEAEMANPFLALNIGTGEGTDVNMLARSIGNNIQTIWNDEGTVRVVPDCRHGAARTGDLRSSLVCADSARTHLGWRPTVALASGLKETVAWFANRQVKSFVGR